MLRKLAAGIAVAVALGFATVIYLVITSAHHDARKEGLPTTNQTLPVIPPVPGSNPANPSPLPRQPEDNRGVVAKAWDDIMSAFAGECSVRSRVIPIQTGGWTPLMDTEDDCIVVYDVPEGGGVGKDSKGDFKLVPGLTRNPVAVRAVRAAEQFKYSLCPNYYSGEALDWNCSTKVNTSAR